MAYYLILLQNIFRGKHWVEQRIIDVGILSKPGNLLKPTFYPSENYTLEVPIEVPILYPENWPPSVGVVFATGGGGARTLVAAQLTCKSAKFEF